MPNDPVFLLLISAPSDSQLSSINKILFLSAILFNSTKSAGLPSKLTAKIALVFEVIADSTRFVAMFNVC